MFFTDKTALDFWRWHATTRSTFEHPIPAGKIRVHGTPDPHADIVSACSHFKQDGPIKILVPTNGARRRSKGIECRMSATALPGGSFWKLAEGVYVSSPEHLFMRYARTASLIELIAIGYSLTAGYATIHGTLSSLQEPMTTIARLSRYVAASAGVKGVPLARQALSHVIPGSASPRETELAMLLSLPKRYGGYGLPKPELNMQITAGKRMSGHVQGMSKRPDLLWASAKVAVEYESDQWHGGGEKFVADSKRRNDMRHMGYDVITVTNDEFRSIERMDRIAGDLRRRLGMRRGREPASFSQRHYELRRLFAGMEGEARRSGLSDFWD